MAGAGYKLFNTGDVLLASEVNTYLMQQTVMVFANATARTSALSGVLAEGMISYLADTNATEVYNGSAWVGITGSGGGANWTLLNAGGTALTGAATITVSGISAVDKIMILVSGASSANVSAALRVRLNTDTANNYYNYGWFLKADSTYNNQNQTPVNSNISGIPLAAMANNAASVMSGYCLISGCNSSGVKIYNAAGGGDDAGGSGQGAYTSGGYYNSASTISSVSVNLTTGNFDAGTLYVYTSA